MSTAQTINPNPKPADLIIGLMDRDRFTYDQDGNLYVICKDISGKNLIINPAGERYRGIIAQRYIQQYMTVPDPKHHRAAVTVKLGETTDKTDLYVRIAGDGIGTGDATVYYDLCNNDEAVMIKPSETGEGVTVIERPLRFKDTGLCGEQHRPSPDSKIEDVKRFYQHIKIKPPIIEDGQQQDLDAINISEIVELRKLVLLVWEIYSLLPDTKAYKLVRPGIKITGAPGSGKSTNEVKIAAIPDPLVSEPGRKPDDLESLSLSLYNRWIPAFDNIKELSDAESDLFCQASTGIDVRRRKRYTDGDTTGNSFRRSAVINGVSDILTRPDAAERYIAIELQKLEPGEYELPDVVMSRFSADLPVIIGAAFKVLSILLYRMISELPRPKTGHRLIQFVTIGRVIADIIEPGRSDDFERTFIEMMESQEAGITDSSPVAGRVIEYMSGQGPSWSRQLTYKHLMDDILKDMQANDLQKTAEYKALSSMSGREFRRELLLHLKGIKAAGIEIRTIEPTPGARTGLSAAYRLKYRKIQED